MWCSLFGGNGAAVRIEPSTGERTLYQLPMADWMRSMRLIHMAFVESKRGLFSVMPAHVFGQEFLVRHYNVVMAFAICSNLVDDAGINALLVMHLTADCKQVRCAAAPAFECPAPPPNRSRRRVVVRPPRR